MNDTNADLYETLFAWTRAWEELLKEPANLLLNRTFCNIVSPALAETKRYLTRSGFIERSAKGWARGLLELLDDQFRQNNIDIQFYRLEYPHEMQDLENLLRQGKFDVSKIYPLLQKIYDGPSVKTVLGALRDELISPGDVDFDRFVAGSALVLRNALSTNSMSSLKDKLSVSLSRHGINLAVPGLLQRISADEQLFERMSESWGLFIDESLSFDVASVKSTPDQGITSLFKLYSWDFKARNLLRKVRATVTSVLVAEGVSIVADVDRVRSRVQEELQKVLLSEYSLAYLTQLFEMPIGGARHESENLERIGQELATILLDHSFEDKQFRHSEPDRPNPVDACCADAFVKTIKELARDKFRLHFGHDSELPELDVTLIRDLVQQLWEVESFKTTDWKNSDPVSIGEICEQWLSSLEVHKQLARILTPLNPLLLNRFRQLLNYPQFSDLREWIKGDAFWQQWRENLSKMASWDRGVFHYIPWHLFDESTIRELFDRVIKDFQPANDNWIVVVSIENVTPPQNPKQITGITFYDPNRWDYGERIWSSSNSASTTSAKINITARTFLEAKRLAVTQLRDVLNCMALSLSVSKMRGGFKPTIDPEIFARRVSTPAWSSDRPLGRNQRPIKQSFLNFERFGPMFDFLIKASRSASATVLQQKLLKALHWYVKARWEDDAAQSLLFYWIALEHLFDEESDDRLLTLIAALHINWRDVLGPGWYFLTRHQDEAMKKLKEDDGLVQILSGHPVLKDWNKDYRVLLNHNNVRALIDLIPSEKKELKDYVIGYEEYLYGFVRGRASIIEDMEELRASYRYRLFVIKQIRNDIVHQALGYESNVAIYTDELENIFEETIVKLTNDAIRAVPQCVSIKDLIAQYEELWIS